MGSGKKPQVIEAPPSGDKPGTIIFKVEYLGQYGRGFAREVVRTIEMEGRHTLDDLQEAIIFLALKWEEGHMYSYYMDNRPYTRNRSMEYASSVEADMAGKRPNSTTIRLKGPTERAHECAQAISRQVGIPLEVEGTYKWLVFLPNKGNGVGALNRYYGAFEDGHLKVRGVEVRKRDTPRFFAEFQSDALEMLVRARDGKEFQEMLPSAWNLPRSGPVT